MKIGLFFGSFNPIHVGHLIIANYMAANTDLDAVWLVVSPHNPHKEKSTLADDYTRLHLVNLAIENNLRLQSCNIEFNLPQPSYTADTLAHLKAQYPKNEFVLIMGGDNLATFHKWKNYEFILKNYQIYVYNRPNANVSAYQNDANVRFFDVPLMEISATFIRQLIQKDCSVRYLVPDKVCEELEKMNLYR